MDQFKTVRALDVPREADGLAGERPVAVQSAEPDAAAFLSGVRVAVVAVVGDGHNSNRSIASNHSRLRR